jgi:hypothetical protein
VKPKQAHVKHKQAHVKCKQTQVEDKLVSMSDQSNDIIAWGYPMHVTILMGTYLPVLAVGLTAPFISTSTLKALSSPSLWSLNFSNISSTTSETKATQAKQNHRK